MFRLLRMGDGNRKNSPIVRNMAAPAALKSTKTS